MSLLIFLFNSWILIDSLKERIFIPETSFFALKFPYPIESLEIYLPYDSLTPLAKEAIKKAPTFLKLDLTNTLLSLPQEKQNLYAQIILNTTHPYLDEVIFTIAHLPKEILINENFYPSLITENAHFLYANDTLLQYCEIVDYGQPLIDTNYYSTIRYRIFDGHDTLILELLKEIYYWYIVHPKISREICTYVDLETGNPSPPPNGKFWRDYLFYYGTPNYPILKDYLIGVRTLWNCQRNDTFNNGAIAQINNWLRRVMEFRTPQRRTYQPCQIYNQHHGTCTEWSILTAAVARASLIPCVRTSAYGNNHHWNEFYERGWHQWEPVNKMINDTTRYDPNWWNLACAFDWRGDGYIFCATKKYTPHCSLKVKVYSSDSSPVDGASVYLLGGHQPVNWFTCFQTTDKEGSTYFILGDTNSYDCQIISSLGEIPYTRIIDFAQANTYYERTFYLSGEMPKVFVKETTLLPIERYRITINFNVDNEIIKNHNPDDGSSYHYKKENGEIDFFITNHQNFLKFLSNDTFTAYLTKKKISFLDTFFLPNLEETYLLFSNKRKINNPQELTLNIKLYKKEVGISEKDFNLFALPLIIKRNNLEKQLKENQNITLYNILGKKEQRPKNKKIYFLTLKKDGKIKKKKIIILN
uniref:Transglutaminase domain-containing protein n=1 Tax=candidate division WOR-3 bacterium TaxID=2052148 RepID=A0A7V5Y0K5_UNCW3